MISDLYRQSEDYFFSALSAACLDLEQDAKAYLTGVPEAALNLVYVRQPLKNIAIFLKRCTAFFQQAPCGFQIMIPEALCDATTTSSLNAMGWFASDQSIAMALLFNKNTCNSPPLPDADVIIKTHDADLKDWMIPLDAFELPSAVTAIYAATHQKALRQKAHLHHFSLYRQAKPVASITLSLHGDCARIDDVATLPDFQRQGYATFLMHHALSAAKQSGAHFCFLESSALGLKTYQKLGFQPIFKNNIYEKIHTT